MGTLFDQNISKRRKANIETKLGISSIIGIKKENVFADAYLLNVNNTQFEILELFDLSGYYVLSLPVS